MKVNIDKVFASVSFNGRLLLKELQNRGIKLSKIGNDIAKVTYKSHTEILHDIYAGIMPYTTGRLIDDKFYAKQFLTYKKFNVVPGEIFIKHTIPNALEYAQSIGFPVVIKPSVGSHGEYVYLDIENKEQLKNKLLHFFKNSEHSFCLVEKQYEGNEFRLFITKKGFFAAVSRIPASIVGDSEKTIRELIKKENYRRMNPRNTCLCEIRMDDIARDFLKKQKKDFEYIPKKGEKIYLRKNSNVSTGGNCYEVTPQVHQSYIDLAKQILVSFPHAPFIGIDLLCEDIKKPLEDYRICELNTAPGLSLHMMPEKGKPRNVAGAIVDLLFPETVKK